MWHHRNEIVHECVKERSNQNESDQLKEKIVMHFRQKKSIVFEKILSKVTKAIARGYMQMASF